MAIAAVTGALLADEIGALLDILDTASETDLVRASGCPGWRVADVIVHLRLGAEGILAWPGLAWRRRHRQRRPGTSRTGGTGR